MCLIIRIASLLQFNQTIGPIFKIVGKLIPDFLNYLLIYTLLAIMFTVVGNLNFLFFMPEFDGFMMSLLTVINTSIGNYKLLGHRQEIESSDN